MMIDESGRPATPPVRSRLLRAEARLRRTDTARMLTEFHEHPNAAGDTGSRRLRFALHREEHQELEAELALGASADPARVARELADVVYVAYGTAWAYGIDLDAALAEVHRAAMHKLRANLKRPDGKILKPPGFIPPDMTEAIRNAHR